MEKECDVEGIPNRANDGISTDGDTTAKEDVQEYKYNYLTEQWGLEDISRYNKGGFHPIHIEDVLDDRYEVVHKLGSGGFGIVWLCRDRHLEKWRAVKVMTADHSSNSAEAKTFEFLKQNSSLEELDKNHIAVPLDSFWIDGPNGRHLCFVLPVYGCTISRWRDRLDDVDPATAKLSKKICQQIVQGLAFLHGKALCHGDFRPSNILMKLDQDALSQLDRAQMLELVEEPEAYEVQTVSGVDPRPRGPEYCVLPLTSEWCEKLIVEEIAITDFGESFLMSSARQSTGIPTSYAAPEILFRQPVGIEVDIWSLACTFYEIRTGRSLFGGSFWGSAFERVVYELEVMLGPLPNLYKKVWDDEGCKGPDHIVKAIEDAGSIVKMAATCSLASLNCARTDITDDTGYNDVFEAKLGKKRIQYPPCIGEGVDKPPVEYRYEDEEVRDLANLLRQMLQYHPENRISAEVIKGHRWLKGKKRPATIHTGLWYVLDMFQRYVKFSALCFAIENIR
ncbi:kinase-like domain-containing protein [Xylaria flabelliformis]|nr:kinase-like domain-containing protein [Xylaria flabelliformis]